MHAIERGFRFTGKYTLWISCVFRIYDMWQDPWYYGNEGDFSCK